MPPRTVLVTGANGFIGSAAARYFAIHGWKTYGFIRSASAASDLIRNQIIPIIGSYADPSVLQTQAPAGFDVIVSTTEDNSAYEKHFAELVALFQAAAKLKRPLVIYTSGNKDYGQAEPGEWKSEDSSLNPPERLRPRCLTAPKIFEFAEWDAVLVRPCMIYGYTGSYYTSILAQAALRDEIVIDGSPEVVWHGVHVDDVASAYLLLATRFAQDGSIKGKAYTVSNDTYDTFQTLAEGISKAYGGKPIKYEQYNGDNPLRRISAFSQALKSDRLRSLGWRPVQMGFLEGLDVFKACFDESIQRRDPATVRLVRLFLGEDAI